MFARVMALAAVLLSSVASAGEPRQPTGKWIVNFADAQCVATRNYGTDADPILLVLKAPATGGSLQVGVVKTGSKGDATQIGGEVVFDETTAVQASLLEFGNKKLNQRALMTNLTAQELAPMREAKSIRIHAREEGLSTIGTRLAVNTNRADDSFTLTQMPALMKTLDSCAADLRKVWKVWDYDKGSTEAGLKAGPQANLGSLFNAEDYPAIALLKDQMGSAAFVLLIDEQGKVADCTVVEPSGVAALDAQSCAIVRQRASFRPAVGLDDKPAKSAFFQRITWRLRH